MGFSDTFYNSDGHFVHFPPTPIGKTSKMTINIQEFHEDREFYQVICDKSIDVLDRVCSVEYKTKVNKKTKEKFTIKFTPKIPFCQIYNYFQILERNGHHINLFVYTESIGPIVEVSKEEITFVCNDKIEERKKVFELRNVSKIDTVFQFDINPQSSFFIIDKLNGIISANNHVYINVYYHGKIPGIHATKLPCLFEHCPPLLINVCAINTLNSDGKNQEFSPNISNCIYYPFPRTESLGFKGYLQDITPVLHFDPPFSITKSFIDFDYVKSGRTSKPDGFSVTNHMKYDIYIVWEIDIQEIFSLTPIHCTIKSDDCEYFECNFRPPEDDKLYGAIINGSIYWTSPLDETFTIPIPLTIRFIGHSFAPDHGIWIPQISLKSEYVIMPPCLPGFCSYKTIVLRKTGILPVLFKFIPPENSKYIIKPMAGLILDDYQIAIVSLCTSEENEEVCYENWKVILNNNVDYEIKFQIRGNTEYPILDIGNNNRIEFNICRTKCQQGALIKIHNKTRHSVKFQIIIPPKLKNYLHVYEKVDVLRAHECIFAFWLWTGVCNGFQTIDITIRTTAIHYKETEFGITQENKVTAYGLVTPTELCSIPSSYYHDECEFNTPFKTYFYIYNFGESEIHYQLDCLYETDCHEQEVNLDPYFETIQPKSNHKITVTVTPHQIGLQQCCIVYNIRTHMYSSEIIEEKSKIIFTFDYFCVLPTLQVVDLSHDNFTPILSKISLWELLAIDSLNTTLANIYPNERKEVYINFPNALLDTEFMISLHLKNISNYKLQCSIERNQLCNCKRTEKHIGISHRKLVYECPHRKTVNVSPKDFVLEGNSIMSLDFSICYILDEKIKLGFYMKLSHNRRIKIVIRIRGINKNKAKSASIISRHPHDIYFKDVYIGSKQPMIQLVWLYNNTMEVVKYNFYTKGIDSLDTELDRIIIQCLNPEGVINGMSNHAIQFIFTPKELRRYELYCVICLGETIFANLKLIGNGIIYPQNYAPLLWGCFPRTSISHDGNLIKLSREHIILKSMHIFNTEDRFLFIENISDIIIGYRWNSVKIPTIIRVMVVQKQGILRPKEKHIIRIRIQAEQNACIVQNVVISCEVFDLKQRRKYETSLVEFNLDKKSIEEFIMTDREILLLSERKITLCPKTNYHTVSISCIILPSNTLTIDLRETIQQQLEHEPCIENYEVLRMKNTINEIEINDTMKYDNAEKEKLVHTLHLFMNILRNNVSLILNCNEFKWNVMRFAKKSPPYYEQIISSPDNAQQQSYPTDKTIASIFRKITLQIITSSFLNIRGDIENTRHKHECLSTSCTNALSVESSTYTTLNNDELSNKFNKNYISLSQTPLYSSNIGFDCFKM